MTRANMPDKITRPVAAIQSLRFTFFAPVATYVSIHLTNIFSSLLYIYYGWFHPYNKNIASQRVHTIISCPNHKQLLMIHIADYDKRWSENTLTITKDMMTSSNGNIFRVTGHLCGEFTGLR